MRGFLARPSGPGKERFDASFRLQASIAKRRGALT